MSILDPANPLLLAAGICALGAVLTAAIAFVVARMGQHSYDLWIAPLILLVLAAGICLAVMVF
ncbi:MAG TPA: hypothetical protein VK053_20860 [Jiangellaceae bacterium]|nr:hypothetical protein [Jiangellaceae bacterium]